MSDPQSDPPIQPAIPARMLTYATPSDGGGMVIIGRFGTVEEAELSASELAGHAIPSQVLNKNMVGMGFPYSGMMDVELHVRTADAEQAGRLLGQLQSDWEPAEKSEIDPPPVDEAGKVILLVEVARFDSVRAMRETQTLLASAGVISFLPPLVPRGDSPAGIGNRFVLRVAEDDIPRARKLLGSHDADDIDPDDLRCPRCGAWRVYPVSQFWKGLAAMVGLAPRPTEQVDCLACKYRGQRSEFTPR